MQKIHLGCGTVYLNDWMNVDLQRRGVFLANNRPDLVTRWKTDEDKYYGRHTDKNIDTVRRGPQENVESVCDSYGSFTEFPGESGTIGEILARQAFEHLSIGEAHKAIDYIEDKLAPNGILRLDVPDHEETVKKLVSSGDPFFARHLLGPRNGDYGYHMMSYRKEDLIKLVQEHGLIFEAEEANVHFYPAFCLRFRKPGPRAAWDYCSSVLPVPDAGARILEIGPGTRPYPFANVFMDNDPSIVNKLKAEGREAYCLSLEEKLPFTHKQFDFVFASHVVEHIQNLKSAISEISRIGRAGVIIVPSTYKDFMFNWEEGDHKWSFFPKTEADPRGGELVAMPLNYQFRSVTADSDFSRSMCRLFRTGPNRHDVDQRLLRRWFYMREMHLDVIHIWQNDIAFRVVQ